MYSAVLLRVNHLSLFILIGTRIIGDKRERLFDYCDNIGNI